MVAESNEIVEYDYDLVTIGAGSGGTRASRFSAQHYGAKVAVVELPFGFVSDDRTGGAGGTCVIRGCVPKKLLVYGSAFSEEFRDAVGFGWEDGQHAFHWETLIQKKSKEIERLNRVYIKLLQDAGVTVIEGRGKLIDAHTIEVELSAGGTRRLTAKTILLAQGGKPVRADIPGKEHAITSDDALVLDHLPSKPILCVGAGYISVEFSGIFNGMGAETHLMYRQPLPLRGFDMECRKHVAENMKGRGIKLYPGTAPTRIDKNEDGSYTVQYQTSDGQKGSMEVGLVFFGTGRAPNTRGIGLEDVGLELTERGAIRVDEYSRTNVPNIYAIGDVTDRLALTPVAIMEGMAFAATVFGNRPTKPIHDKVASAVFIRPPLATCGLTEEQAVERLATDVDIYVSRFKPMKNTLSGRDERTLMKLIVRSDTDEVVGAHMVGDDAAEIMQGIAIAMKCNAKKADFDATVGIHPTAAEEFVTMRTLARRVTCKGCEPAPAYPQDLPKHDSRMH